MSNTERLLFEVLKSLQELQSEVTEIKKNTYKLTVDIAEIKSKLDMDNNKDKSELYEGECCFDY